MGCYPALASRFEPEESRESAFLELHHKLAPAQGGEAVADTLALSQFARLSGNAAGAAHVAGRQGR